MPDFLKQATSILDAVPNDDPAAKNSAVKAFMMANDRDSFVQQLQGLNLPQSVKADLYEAKRPHFGKNLHAEQEMFDVTQNPVTTPQQIAQGLVAQHETTQPPNSGIGRVASEWWNEVNPMNLVNALRTENLGSTAKSILTQGGLGDKAVESWKQGDYGGALQHGMYSLVPFIGPSLDAAGEKFKQGDYTGGIGQTLGVATNMLVPEKAPGIVRAAKDTVTKARVAPKTTAKAPIKMDTSTGIERPPAVVTEPPKAPLQIEAPVTPEQYSKNKAAGTATKKPTPQQWTIDPRQTAPPPTQVSRPQYRPKYGPEEVKPEVVDAEIVEPQSTELVPTGKPPVASPRFAGSGSGMMDTRNPPPVDVAKALPEGSGPKVLPEGSEATADLQRGVGRLPVNRNVISDLADATPEQLSEYHEYAKQNLEGAKTPAEKDAAKKTLNSINYVRFSKSIENPAFGNSMELRDSFMFDEPTAEQWSGTPKKTEPGVVEKYAPGAEPKGSPAKATQPEAAPAAQAPEVPVTTAPPVVKKAKATAPTATPGPVAPAAQEAPKAPKVAAPKTENEKIAVDKGGSTDGSVIYDETGTPLEKITPEPKTKSAPVVTKKANALEEIPSQGGKASVRNSDGSVEVIKLDQGERLFSHKDKTYIVKQKGNSVEIQNGYGEKIDTMPLAETPEKTLALYLEADTPIANTPTPAATPKGPTPPKETKAPVAQPAAVAKPAVAAAKQQSVAKPAAAAATAGGGEPRTSKPPVSTKAPAASSKGVPEPKASKPEPSKSEPSAPQLKAKSAVDNRATIAKNMTDRDYHNKVYDLIYRVKDAKIKARAVSNITKLEKHIGKKNPIPDAELMPLLKDLDEIRALKAEALSPEFDFLRDKTSDRVGASGSDGTAGTK